MNYVKGFLIIILISFFGETIKDIVPLPVPASIYGILIMLFCLCTGIIKIDAVKKTSNFLLMIFPIMFVPPAVELMNIWVDLKSMILPITVITVLSTIIVMIVTGIVTQKVVALQDKNNINENNNEKINIDKNHEFDFKEKD